ncbi:MAG: ABC transporter ATP-binding protein [Anaerolineae bacterium]|nr:ABC transporter ATP-binding protein [Anaerolineae bacterium]
MIELMGLTKCFDDFTAVDGLTLSVQPGEILALLGPNGAGKTTTVRMLAAILRPTAGEARVAGYSVTEQAREVRRRVGVLTEHPGLYLRMRGGQYLDYFGRLMGLNAEERERRARELLARFGMADAWDRRMGTYSKGMRQKIALVRAMLHDPSVLLLDEPTSAMDPHSAKLVRDAVVGLRHHRRAIVLCTHNLPEAEVIADRIAIIRHGCIIALGKPDELKSRLLGAPLMELRLARPIGDPRQNGVVKLVSDLVKVEAHGEGWVRYFTPNPQEVNPRLLGLLATHGVGVVTLSEVGRSLEDVYLRVVEEV